MESQPTGQHPPRSRSGLVLLVVGVSLFGVAFVVGVVSFFVPWEPAMHPMEVLTVLLPGPIAVVGFSLGVAGFLLLLLRR